MAEEIIAKKIIDLTNLGSFWTKVKEYIDSTGGGIEGKLANYAKKSDLNIYLKTEDAVEAYAPKALVNTVGNLSDTVGLKVDSSSFDTYKTSASETFATKEELGNVSDVANSAKTAIDTFMNTVESSTEAIDTLKEILDLIESKGSSETVQQLLSDVSQNKTNITNLTSDFGAYKTIVSNTYATKVSVDELSATVNSISNYTSAEIDSIFS
jgi:hypothetical protein